MYRQLFAIGVMPLFSDTGDLLAKSGTITDKIFILSEAPKEDAFKDLVAGLSV